MALTDRQKVAHLLRRFGFGASLPEMDEYVPLGPEGALNRLLDIHASPDVGFVPQWAFKKDEEAEPGGYRFRLHWILQMAVTKTPLKEKLALFWHDHFAVNEEDVEHGIAMMDYLETIRKNPGGKFKDILTSMMTNVALMRQLNVEMISRATPNENFARELLELYTLGEGNYTEKDIKEIARALTGHSHYDAFWRMGQENTERMNHIIKHDTPGVFAIYADSVHIPGPKTVLGQTVESSADVVAMLSKHPQTARYICGKLWEWFAYASPEPETVEKLAKKFLAHDGNIIETLRSMTKMDEFWSDKCVRNLVKNPVDYVVGIVRAQNSRERILRDFPKDNTKSTPIPEDVMGSTSGIMYFLSECGMNLFFPQTVAGWDWGKGWISTNTLIQRKRFTGVHTYYRVEKEGKEEWLPDLPTQYVTNEIKKRKPQSVEAIVAAFCTIYDCPLSIEQNAVLVKHFEKMGGVGVLEAGHFAWSCTLALQLLGSAPEFHMC